MTQKNPAKRRILRQGDWHFQYLGRSQASHRQAIWRIWGNNERYSWIMTRSTLQELLDCLREVELEQLAKAPKTG